jgi:hypothetical protein
MTYAEMIDRAYFQALRGMDANTAPNLDDATTIMEALVPTVFQEVALQYAGDPDQQSLLRRTHTISMSNGAGTLPDEVLSQCLNNASVADPADISVGKFQTFVPQYPDFIGPRDNIQIQLNWWTCKGDTDFLFLEANEEYDPSSGFTGDLELTAPSVPAVPATASDPVVVPEEVASDLVEALADSLRREINKKAAA